MHTKCVERSRLLHSLITEKNNNATTRAFSQQEKQKLIHNQRERDKKVLREMKQTPVVHVSCQSVFFLFSVVFFGFLSFIVFDCIYRFVLFFFRFLLFSILFLSFSIVFLSFSIVFFIVFYCFLLYFYRFLLFFIGFFIVFYCFLLYFYRFLLFFHCFYRFLLFSVVFFGFYRFLFFFIVFLIVFYCIFIGFLSKISVLLLSTQSNACIVYIC